MFTIRKSIDIDFAHSVAGHPGACINIHGHTWKFEVVLAAETLNANNFVTDFGNLKREVLTPVHLLLDHSYACGQEVYEKGREGFKMLGEVLVGTRKKLAITDDDEDEDEGLGYKYLSRVLHGAKNHLPGGIKIAVFPFNPTSELLAEWLYHVAENWARKEAGFTVLEALVYETLHPVEAVASYIKTK